MSKAAAKLLIKRLVNTLGFEIRRRGPRSADSQWPRESLVGLLQQARSLGWAPATVIDVGAAYGWFTLECRSVFPDARYVLIEPLEEYGAALRRLVETVPHVEYVQAAATSFLGEVAINVHPDLVGSSVYLEGEDSGVNGVPRAVPSVTLDDLQREKELRAPFLMKIDVQGAELDVLRGAEALLAKTEYVLLEVSLFAFFKGGPALFDVLSYMGARGFVVYDLCGLQYRPLDHALSQVDVAFCKETGLFRTHNSYANSLQRAEQDHKFQLQHERLMRKYGGMR